jgi:L,D-transpeptidase ErfK/SrfK
MKLVVASLFILTASTLFGADMIIGGVTRYTVQKGDHLPLIGAKLGVFWKNIARENDLDPQAACIPGQELKVTTRRIVPRIVKNGIIINIADRTLYHFTKGTLTAYPVGVGLPSQTEFGDWRTPTGKFVIVGKTKDPTWSVPYSIRMEMASKGKPVEESVPPGPTNPLGRYVLRTSLPGVLIHETIRPASVYRFQSHGCIRMLPEDIERLFQEVKRGTKGEIVYEPVKVARGEDERLYLEVRTDTYKTIPSIRDHVRRLLDERGFSGEADAARVDRIIKDQTGIAEDITLASKDPL